MYKIIKYEEKYQEELTEFVISIFIKEFGFEHCRKACEEVNVMQYIQDGGNCWIAVNENENEIIGSILLVNNFNNTAELKMMYLKKEYRGKGVSQSLLNTFFQYAKKNEYKKIFLGTYDRLDRAIQFYKKNGFIEYEKEKYTIDDRYFYLDIHNIKNICV